MLIRWTINTRLFMLVLYVGAMLAAMVPHQHGSPETCLEDSGPAHACRCEGHGHDQHDAPGEAPSAPRHSTCDDCAICRAMAQQASPCEIEFTESLLETTAEPAIQTPSPLARDLYFFAARGCRAPPFA